MRFTFISGYSFEVCIIANWKRIVDLAGKETLSQSTFAHETIVLYFTTCLTHKAEKGEKNVFITVKKPWFLENFPTIIDEVWQGSLGL